jgi:hypothetical protein
MLEAAISGLDLPQPDDDRPPVEQLVDLLVSMRASFLANIDLFHLAPTRLDLPTGWAATDKVWSALIASEPNPAKAAELYTTLIQLCVGSAIETARSLGSRKRHATMLTELERAGDRPRAEAARAMLGVDRDRAFEALVRRLLTAR